MDDYILLINVPPGYTISVTTRSYLDHQSWYTSFIRTYYQESRHTLYEWLVTVIDKLRYDKTWDSNRNGEIVAALNRLIATYSGDDTYQIQLQQLITMVPLITVIIPDSSDEDNLSWYPEEVPEISYVTDILFRYRSR